MKHVKECVMKADADVGILTVNWQTRTLLVEGLHGDGDARNMRSPEQVLARLQKAEATADPDVEVWGLALHRDNTQLCLHDLEGFLLYIYGPEDDDGS